MTARHRILAALALLAAALALLASGCASLPKTSADFVEVTKRMDVIAVMPPAFNLTQAGAFTGESVNEINHLIESELLTAAGSLVAESRYKRASFDVSDAVLAQDAELRTALFEQHQAMNDVFKALAKSRAKTIDIPYHANIDLIADRSGAEYLLFLNGSGYFSTTGAKVKGAILAGLTGVGRFTSNSMLAGVLVDAKTGKVVWYNVAQRPNYDPRKPSQLMMTAQMLTKPLLGQSQIKQDHTRDQFIIEKMAAK
jgi:hypothetical protein